MHDAPAIAIAQAQFWAAHDPDPDNRALAQAMLKHNDTAALTEHFTGRLSFGTAGLRAHLGPGPQRMNRLVVRQTSLGLARYVMSQMPQAPARGVVVAYDGRHGSQIFAADAAGVFCAQGFRVMLFDRCVPTPVAGYAVRAKSAVLGCVITASHNPPAYNGYKVYWENGAQIIPPHDRGILARIEDLAGEIVDCMPLSQARHSGLLQDVGDELYDAYLRGVRRVSRQHSVDDGARAAVKIAYTPLHGVGATLAERALREGGFTDVQTVPSQREPDGDFPTVRFPNPEEDGAMDAVLELAQQTQAHLACASDPDADRFAVAVRREDGAYQQLGGNEVGFLLADMFAKQTYGRGVMATTLVSSRLLSQICQAHGLRYFETLTGFKWIANGALVAQASGDKFLFAYEEALGYSIGDLVWDKDGISAMCAFCELFASLRARGSTIFAQLETIYRQYGLYLDGHKSLKLAGPIHPDTPSLCDKLRRTPPQQIAGQAIVATRDLRHDPPKSPFGQFSLPPSDVLIYHLQDASRVIVRPSGTEPKVKCYYEVVAKIAANESFEKVHGVARERLENLIAAHQQMLEIL